MRSLRIRAVWLAIGLVLGGSAFAVAGVATQPTSEVPKPDKVKAQRVADDAKDPSEEAGSRPHNHGFFVSRAAHCKNVNDPATDASFDAPGNCDTNGKAHGEYVSSVARSQAGKSFNDAE